MTKSAKQPTSTEETADEIARDAFREALIGIRDEIKAIRAGRKKPEKHTPAESIAYLAKQAASFASELRKADAADRRRTESLTKALVLEWFRQLEQSERAQFVRELQHLDTKRSGLA